jgi:hypothetical protein
LRGANAGQQQHDDEQNAERMVAMHTSSSKVCEFNLPRENTTACRRKDLPVTGRLEIVSVLDF